MLKEKSPRSIGKPFIKGTLLVLVFIVFSFLTTTAYSETLFRVSGKVLRKGKGVKGVVVLCEGLKDYSINGKRELFFKYETTNNKGEFVFELSRGEYRVLLPDIVYDKENPLYTLIEPRDIKIKVKDRNIKNLNLYLYTEEEIIEANRDILEAVPENKPHVEYKWGRIPLHSEKECYKYVKMRYEEDTTVNHPDCKTKCCPQGAKMLKPIVLYDYRGNPICYLYQFMKNDRTVIYYEVFAIGDEIEETVNSGKIIEDEVCDYYEKTNYKFNFWKDIMKSTLRKIAKAKKCKEEDIEIIKIISGDLGARNQFFYNRYLMIKIKPSGEKDIIAFEDNDITFLKLDLKKIQYLYEMYTTLEYITQVKERQHRPLMEKKK